MNKELANFIKENRDLIKDNNFQELYERLDVDLIRNLTPILLKANIDPLVYMDYVPVQYLLNSSISFIAIPNNIKRIELRAFSGCRGLKSVTIPNSVKSIGIEAFSGCRKLTSITIPDSVTSIGDGAFSYSGLTSVTIPDGVKKIYRDMCYDCSELTRVVIPNSVTSIDSFALADCPSLKNITFKGTKEEWKKVKKGYAWRQGTNGISVQCTDGDLKI